VQLELLLQEMLLQVMLLQVMLLQSQLLQKELLHGRLFSSPSVPLVFSSLSPFFSGLVAVS
jgi:hypothetical protein